MDRTDNRAELPSPLYAAAGAGEVAYQKLRQLPELAARTMRTAGQTAEELRRRFAARERDLTVDLARVRESAQRGTAVVAAKAVNAQERAVVGYRNLVARGERVVASRFGVATGQTEPGKIEVEVGPVTAERPSATGRTADQAAPTTPTTPPAAPTTPATPTMATTPSAAPTTPTAEPTTPPAAPGAPATGPTTPAG